jgi:type IV pilus assembly protein PilX
MMKKESGFVLVTGMVFLVVLTIIVIYMLRGSIMQERMTSNSIDRQRALQAADAVLREAEDLVSKSINNPPFDPFVIEGFTSNCASGLCKNLSTTTSPWTSVTWSSVKDSLLGFNQSKVKTPSYVIELIVPPINKPGVGCDAAVYRIVAKGSGNTGADVVVQSYLQVTPKLCP